MSGYSDSGTCPNCNSDKYEIVVDWKPFNLESTYCYDCGFNTHTQVQIDSLENLNAEREECGEWEGKALRSLKNKRPQTQWAKEKMKYYLGFDEEGNLFEEKE